MSQGGPPANYLPTQLLLTPLNSPKWPNHLKSSWRGPFKLHRRCWENRNDQHCSCSFLHTQQYKQTPLFSETSGQLFFCYLSGVSVCCKDLFSELFCLGFELIFQNLIKFLSESFADNRIAWCLQTFSIYTLFVNFQSILFLLILYWFIESTHARTLRWMKRLKKKKWS